MWYQIKLLLLLSFIRQKEIQLIIDFPQFPLFHDLPEPMGKVSGQYWFCWRSFGGTTGHTWISQCSHCLGGSSCWEAPGACSACLLWQTLSDLVEGALPSSWNIPGARPLIQLAAEGMWFALRPLHTASSKVLSSWRAWLSALAHVYVQMSKMEIPSHLNCGFCQMY